MVWSQTDRGDHDLHVFRADGPPNQVLQGERGVDERDPTLSGDASRIAWTSVDLRDRDSQPQIVLGDHGKITPVTREGSNAWPQLSRDGRVLVWLSYDPEKKTQSIYRLELDRPE